MHLGHLLTRAAVRWPDRPAWLEGDVVVTFREAEARVNRLAHALLALGARPATGSACWSPTAGKVWRRSSPP